MLHVGSYLFVFFGSQNFLPPMFCDKNQQNSTSVGPKTRRRTIFTKMDFVERIREVSLDARRWNRISLWVVSSKKWLLNGCWFGLLGFILIFCVVLVIFLGMFFCPPKITLAQGSWRVCVFLPFFHVFQSYFLPSLRRYRGPCPRILSAEEPGFEHRVGFSKPC